MNRAALPTSIIWRPNRGLAPSGDPKVDLQLIALLDLAPPVARLAVWLLIDAALAFCIHYAFFFVAGRIAGRSRPILQSLLRRARAPARAFLLLVSLLPTLQIAPHVEPRVSPFVAPAEHGVVLSVIASLTWLVVALSYTFEDLVEVVLNPDQRDNLEARRARTRVGVLRRIGAGLTIFVAVAVMLMTFPAVRHLGVSLLASAGIVGVVAGLAAQRTIGNLIAGLLIAWTQPIRLDDVVVVEGEWGWIEEIGWTHVVVRIWDLRRLVLPLSYFLEKPFQNWTRQSAEILGTVFVYTDYIVPVDELRKALRGILDSSGLWDGNVCALQVTGATERGIELRALMSATDSPTAWDLRCYVREKLVEFLRTHYPESLPRTRAVVAGPPAVAAAHTAEAEVARANVTRDARPRPFSGA